MNRFKWTFGVFLGIGLLVISSCTKEIEEPKAINATPIQSENGVFVLPCHSTAFFTNYVIQAGKVPPFRFTKTQYPSGRIRTINMLSRANPIHSAFKPQAWEMIGTFTYNLKDQAYFTGTKQLWEYYKKPTGAAAKRSIIKKNVSLTFFFYDDNPENEGYYFRGDVYRVYNNLEKQEALRPWAFGGIEVLPGSDEPEGNFYSGPTGEEGTFVIKTTNPSSYKASKKITFKYKPEEVKKSRSYQPTQNWISLEYTLCEAMQWLQKDFQSPPGERTSVAVEFYPYNTSYKVVQSQIYKNHKYDTNGNLLSYTYGDNVLQKTTWVCK